MRESMMGIPPKELGIEPEVAPKKSFLERAGESKAARILLPVVALATLIGPIGRVEAADGGNKAKEYSSLVNGATTHVKIESVKEFHPELIERSEEDGSQQIKFEDGKNFKEFAQTSAAMIARQQAEGFDSKKDAQKIIDDATKQVEEKYAGKKGMIQAFKTAVTAQLNQLFGKNSIGEKAVPAATLGDMAGDIGKDLADAHMAMEKAGVSHEEAIKVMGDIEQVELRISVDRAVMSEPSVEQVK